VLKRDVTVEVKNVCPFSRYAPRAAERNVYRCDLGCRQILFDQPVCLSEIVDEAKVLNGCSGTSAGSIAHASLARLAAAPVTVAYSSQSSQVLADCLNQPTVATFVAKSAPATVIIVTLLTVEVTVAVPSMLVTKEVMSRYAATAVTVATVLTTNTT
jgi:hypothetical protein